MTARFDSAGDMTLFSYYRVPRERNFQAVDRLDDTRMKCQRCWSGEEATYRVYSDALDMAFARLAPLKLANWDSLLSL
jgi:hypothetical protein